QTTTASRGTSPVASVQIGKEAKSQPFAVVVDNVVLSTDSTTSTDTIPPDTSITAGPSGTVTSDSATFSFTATEAGSSFQCRLDGAAFSQCTSPTSYSGLAGGSHTFDVRAIDPAGNVDPTPATRTWTVAVTAGTPDKLLIADLRNRRLLITDFNGRLIWKFDNPTGQTSTSAGPLGVRRVDGNRILATFGTGEVGLIDVATKTWLWKYTGFNGSFFQSPYDAELLPDGNL